MNATIMATCPLPANIGDSRSDTGRTRNENWTSMAGSWSHHNGAARVRIWMNRERRSER